MTDPWKHGTFTIYLHEWLIQNSKLVGFLYMDPSWVFATICPVESHDSKKRPQNCEKKRPGCAVPVGRGSRHDPLVHVTCLGGFQVLGCA